ncbi:glycine cleavage system aminomethyltransferase GcvT [Actinomyces vulturis]|uniref:glycine cleavage system aminomethyltransferase GcvT n=1 Tax=Actinomyces vulturis TaxID=1857645 RepID=UPI00082A8E08|nr:glycine cleavage system aminomethyltransferase GcvT [Actinomyces vulturis]
MTSELRRTCLYNTHHEAGASFTNFGGWDMPLRYSSDVGEHHAVRRRAGIFDLSHMGELSINGPEAAQALDYALVGSVSTVPLGRAKYMMICHPNGGIMDDLIVYHLGDDHYMVVPNAGNRERVAAAIIERCADFDCTVEDVSLSTALIAVQGPLAVHIMAPAITKAEIYPAAMRPVAKTDGVIDDNSHEPIHLDGNGLTAYLRYYAACNAVIDGCPVVVARTGYTGEDGFEVFCSTDDAAKLWSVFMAIGSQIDPIDHGIPESGPALVPCGLASRDSLRLEAGMPLYGHELSDELTPFDAGLATVIKEEGDFVGKEALEQRACHEGRAETYVLVALVGEGRRAARAGYEVYSADHGDEPVGVVTSGLLSPTLGYPIALVRMMPYTSHEPTWPAGAVVEVDVRGKRMPMHVVTPPFYKRPKKA